MPMMHYDLGYRSTDKNDVDSDWLLYLARISVKLHKLGLIFILWLPAIIAYGTIVKYRAKYCTTARDTEQKQLQALSIKTLIGPLGRLLHHWPDSPRVKKHRKRSKYKKLAGWRKCKCRKGSKKKDKGRGKKRQKSNKDVKSSRNSRARAPDKIDHEPVQPVPIQLNFGNPVTTRHHSRPGRSEKRRKGSKKKDTGRGKRRQKFKDVKSSRNSRARAPDKIDHEPVQAVPIQLSFGNPVTTRRHSRPGRSEKHSTQCKYQKLNSWKRYKRKNSNKKKGIKQDRRKKSKNKRVKSTKRLPDKSGFINSNSSNDITISKCELATEKHTVISSNENAQLNCDNSTLLNHHSPPVQHHDHFDIIQYEQFVLASPVTSLALPIRDTDSELYETYLCYSDQ